MNLAINYNNFDVLGFIDKLIKVGVERKVAEVQAKELEHMQSHNVELISNLTTTVQEQKIEIDSLKTKEPATKKDLEVTKLELQKEIKTVELTLQKEIEIVRREIKAVELNLQKEIKTVELTLQKDIKSLEVKLLIIYGSGFLILLGVLAKGFGWL